MLDLKLIEKLTNAPGVSGNENAVRAIIRAGIERHVDDIRVDALGNLIAYKRATGNGKRGTGPKVMLAAHMDEVGLMVTFIDKQGYLRFDKVGGVDNRVLLAKRVLVGKDRTPGVIGVRPIHMIWRKGEHKKVSTNEELVIDIGAASQEEAQKAAAVGDYVVFDTACEDWGALLKAKAFDDRIGCYLMMELLKGSYPFPLYAAFTTQEEVGLRGARVAAYRTLPDIAFILEGTGAADMPQPKEGDTSRVPALGKGPVVTVMDRSVFCDKGLVKLLRDTAHAGRIPLQVKQPGIGGTDAGRIHITREGVRTVVLAIPARYIHSPVCLMAKADIANGLKLMQAALAKVR
ncbi:MAG: M42 family metallopeptidase [Candidatus Edwardsbacteria bacterium]|jgi:endoglucanase|nr:M42 family metallopeptidase [Candidatus Edwardsbacteria bacterium]